MKAAFVKSIALVALSLGAAQAQAECQINSHADRAVDDLFNSMGGWSSDRGLSFEKYNEVCKKLERAGAGIEVSAMARVMDGYAVSWAQLTVRDKDTSIGSTDFGSQYMRLSGIGTQQKADENMVFAINLALSNWVDLDKAIEALEKERKIARTEMLRKR